MFQILVLLMKQEASEDCGSTCQAHPFKGMPLLSYPTYPFSLTRRNVAEMSPQRQHTHPNKQGTW